jgi:transcriptional regulator with XRE-family HTH domain
MTGLEYKARLKAVGATQEELGRALGKDRSTVAHILSGRTRLLVDVANQIEAFLAPLEAAMRAKSGVWETASRVEPAPSPLAPPHVSAQRKCLSADELEKLIREIGELSAVLRNAPRLTDMTDDELLGYDTPS